MRLKNESWIMQWWYAAQRVLGATPVTGAPKTVCDIASALTLAPLIWTFTRFCGAWFALCIGGMVIFGTAGLYGEALSEDIVPVWTGLHVAAAIPMVTALVTLLTWKACALIVEIVPATITHPIRRTLCRPVEII